MPFVKVPGAPTTKAMQGKMKVDYQSAQNAIGVPHAVALSSVSFSMPYDQMCTLLKESFCVLR